MAQYPLFRHPSDNEPEESRGKWKDGPVELKNPHIQKMDEDVLYHLALSNKSHDLKEMFHDVKFVCFGGSPTRMEKFVTFMAKELQFKIPAGMTLQNISHGSDRYVLYKVGPVLSVSHGMGIPSLSIVFHEILKLLHHAGCTDVKMFRLGTSGGLALDPGTVVISEAAVDGLLRPYMEIATLGMILQHPAFLDKELNEELHAVADELGFKSVIGKTMCTYDFYEGQARLDGAFCDFNEEDKMSFLKRIHDRGIRNIEMESLCFAAMAYRARVKNSNKLHRPISASTLCSDRPEARIYCTYHSPLQSLRSCSNCKSYFPFHLGVGCKLTNLTVFDGDDVTDSFDLFPPKHTEVKYRKGAILCCTIIDRLKGDQITASHETLEEWQERPQKIISRYIQKQLGMIK